MQNLIEGDLRDTLVAKQQRKRKMTSTSDELVATQDALKRVTEEIDALRAEMKKIRESATSGTLDKFAFGFDPKEFNAMNFTQGLAWVNDTLVDKLKQEMTKFPDSFLIFTQLGNVKETGVRICARFNRGDSCTNSWHVHNKPKKGKSGYHRELRLHCCAVCMGALGIFANHHMMECPWLKSTTWEELQLSQSKNKM